MSVTRRCARSWDRIATAQAAGCDGIEPSGLAGFWRHWAHFTRADQLDYDRWLAGVVHGAGLSIGLVENDAGLAADLLGDFDWTIVWNCLDTGCAAAGPFVGAGKAAFLVEYGDETRAPPSVPGRAISAYRRSSSATAISTRSASAVPERAAQARVPARQNRRAD